MIDQDELFDEEKESFLIFNLENSSYAFHSADVNKVHPQVPVTFIPGCPDYVLGIIHIRGDIESVINLRTIFGLKNSKTKKTSRILIVEKDSFKTGILVDSIEDIADIPVSQISPVMSTLPDRIKAVAKGEFDFKDHHTIIIDATALAQQISKVRS